MKSYKLKCKLHHNFVMDEERPEVGKSYTVTDVKKVIIKNTNKYWFAFKLKEFEDNEFQQWFSEDTFELGKKNIIENFVEII